MAVDAKIPRGSRRAFLLGAGALTAPAMLPSSTDRPNGEPEDMQAVARLANLQFSDAECQLASGRLKDQRQEITALRRTPIPFELSPCASFEPVPLGQPLPRAGKGMTWTPAADLEPPVDDDEIAFAEVPQLAAWLRTGDVTSRRLTELSLARLQQHDPRLHCVITLLREEALRTADERDEELRLGKARSPLHGIPYGAKDLFAWPGAPTTFGAGPYRNHVWDLRATALHKLHEAGAVLVAKLSLGALAMGDLWHGGRTRNPWNPDEGSSGSSAGSASAVAAGLVPFALGTETLGSIVSPCRQCGVGGLRPTFGAISRHGAMPLSWTMDKVGPIARSALSLGLVFDAIRGRDDKDPSARDATFAFDPERSLAGLKVGVVTDGGRWRDEDRAFVKWLEGHCGAAKPVTLPRAPYGSMLLMLHAESAAAFDELLRAGKLGELPGQDEGDWPNQFRAARCIPAADYLQASRLRTQLIHDMAAVMAGIDVLVAPTHGGATMTCTNLTGHPTLVLPVGSSDLEKGRPTVLGLTGGLYGEAALLHVAASWQRETDWHRRRPTLQ